MGSDLTPSDALAGVVRALERACVPYMLTGSLASSLHGMPRSTQDIDVVIAPDADGLQRLLREFTEDRFYVSPDAAREAFAGAGSFNIIDLVSGWKFDFIFRKHREFSRREFDRRRSAEALGIRMYVATPEDVLIAKLEWAKLGESERQIRDAAGIIRTQGEDLDIAYVGSWVKDLGLEAQWALAQAAASDE